MTDTTTSNTEVSEPVKGTWQHDLHQSGVLKVRAGHANKRASELLWAGAQAGITEWESKADTDVSAEGLYNEVMTALGGTSRKGDASKIRTVALAVRSNGLELAAHKNLSQAYKQALALTKVAAQQSAEDDAAEKAVAALAKNAPKSSSTPEGAALIVLSKGVDEAARLLLDALGASNEAAHRSLLRALSQEIAGRVKPVVKPKKAAAPKKVAKATKSAKAKPVVKDGAAKAKPKASVAPTAKARPVAKAKAKPVVRKG